LEDEILLQLLKGAEILPFTPAACEKMLIYTHDGTDWNKTPNILRHLGRFRDKLEARAECNEGLYPWWRLQRPRDPRIVLAPKILSPIYATYNRFAMSVKRPFAMGVTDSISYALKPEYASDWQIEFIIGILNSATAQFYHKRRSKLKRADTMNISSSQLIGFPFRRCSMLAHLSTI
jgi:hypothetical protein